ncbi:MAG: YraN family protein [Proteobacteria bacterium]|nr:MAG: YraN family protein [Pseudomonadota bacterium]
MSRQRRKTGQDGEAIAAAHLTDQGIEILCRNYRNRFGEIDIIGNDQGTYIFVEVKTRKSNRYGSPQEAVTLKKQSQISNIAQSYLQQHNLTDIPVRFDVIAITFDQDKPLVNHIVAAFDSQR